MKNSSFAKWCLLVTALTLIGGCAQGSANSAQAIPAITNQDNLVSALTATSDAQPAAAEQDLENAPGKIVSVAQPPAQSAGLGAPAAEIAKLAQAGVDDSVMLAFITNSPNTFNLGSDQIIYLNGGDVGWHHVSGSGIQ